MKVSIFALIAGAALVAASPCCPCCNCNGGPEDGCPPSGSKRDLEAGGLTSLPRRFAEQWAQIHAAREAKAEAVEVEVKSS